MAAQLRTPAFRRWREGDLSCRSDSRVYSVWGKASQNLSRKEDVLVRVSMAIKRHPDHSNS